MKSTSADTEAWPFFDEEMVEAATRVLRSGRVNYWTGDEGLLFEREFAHYIGVSHAIAVTNGTAALEIALRAGGIGPGDEVIVPCRTFIATASAVAATGARPVFADVDYRSQCLTANTIRPHLSDRTKAIIAVHLAGWPCDVPAIRSLTEDLDLLIVEDCAQAHGAALGGQRVGSLGDVAAFSFCQDKILTTCGEGGMITTNDDQLYERMWSLKDHGKSSSLRTDRLQTGISFRWVHGSLGSNYRLSEMQSAVGRVQLRRLDAWVAKRRSHSERLAEACRRTEVLQVAEPTPTEFHARYKFYITVRPDRLASGWSREQLIKAFRDRGVACSSGSCSEVYREAAFHSEWRPTAPMPNAQALGENSLMLLVHPTLRDETIAQAITTIDEVTAIAASTPHQHAA